MHTVARHTREVSVAALCFSVVAIAISIWALVYSKRQTVAVEKTAANDTARRHDERTPAFTAELIPVNTGSPYYKLRLRLDSHQALTSLSAELRGAAVGTQFTPGTTGVAADAPAPVHQAVAVVDDGVAVHPFGTITWQLELQASDWPDSGLSLLVTAGLDAETWTVVVPIPMPEDWVVPSRDW